MGTSTSRSHYRNGVWTRPEPNFGKRALRNGAALGDAIARAAKGEPVEGVTLEEIAEHRVCAAEYMEDR